jgi:hypothetical protein
LITAVSKPKRKPPIAAALAISTTRAVAAGGRGTLANASLLMAQAPVDDSILLRGSRCGGLNTYSQIHGRGAESMLPLSGRESILNPTVS